ncbi:hypothetical protein FACS189449_04630 [Alphaproteobacteria bacterium]|nr:hypothetical protein FACS189449_04630 [Alphaproteobacteria bacterium]
MKKIAIAFCLLEAAALNAMEGTVLIRLIGLMPEKTQEIRALAGMCDEHYNVVKMRPAFKSIRIAYVSRNTEDMMKLIHQKTPAKMMYEGRFEEAMKVFKNRLYVAQKAKNVPLANEARGFIAEANRRMIQHLRQGTPGIRYVDFRTPENLESLFEADTSRKSYGILGIRAKNPWEKDLEQIVLDKLREDHPREKISIESAKILWQKGCWGISEIADVDFRKVDDLKELFGAKTDNDGWGYVAVMEKLKKDHPGEKISVECIKFLLSRNSLDGEEKRIMEITNVEDLRKPGTFEDLCAAISYCHNCSHRKLSLASAMADKLKENFPGEKIISAEYALYLLRLHDEYTLPECLNLQDIVKFDDSDRSQKIKDLFGKFKAVHGWFGDSPEIDAYYAALRKLGEPRL